MSEKFIFFAVILPDDAPRILSRLIPVFNCQYKIISFRGSKSLFYVWRLMKELRAVTRDRVVVIMDPLALLLWFALRHNAGIVIYDRNERWPENFKFRKRSLLRFLFHLRVPWLALERRLMNRADMFIATDYITRRRLSRNRAAIIVPNRNYDVPGRVNCHSLFSDSALYLGTFSEGRGCVEIVKFVTLVRTAFWNDFGLEVWARSPGQGYFSQHGIRFNRFDPVFSNHDALNMKFRFGICAASGDYLAQVVPSKVSAYLQLGLPILLLGDQKIFSRLSSWMPRAFFNLANLEDANELRVFQDWLQNVSVNYIASERRFGVDPFLRTPDSVVVH